MSPWETIRGARSSAIDYGRNMSPWETIRGARSSAIGHGRNMSPWETIRGARSSAIGHGRNLSDCDAATALAGECPLWWTVFRSSEIPPSNSLAGSSRPHRPPHPSARVPECPSARVPEYQEITIRNEEPSEPSLPRVYRGEVAKSRLLGRRTRKPRACSGSGMSEHAARPSAVGEGVERYSAGCRLGRLRFTRGEVDARSLLPRERSSGRRDPRIVAACLAPERSSWGGSAGGRCHRGARLGPGGLGANETVRGPEPSAMSAERPRSLNGGASRSLSFRYDRIRAARR